MHPIRRRRFILILISLASVACAVALVLSALGENLNHFYPPQEILQGKAPEGRTIRVGGMVVKGSLKRVPSSLQLTFIITDFKADVLVKYAGILPDLFREGQGVVVVGKLLPDHVVMAEQVLAKHDEKYMPPEAAEALRRAKKI